MASPAPHAPAPPSQPPPPHPSRWPPWLLRRYLFGRETLDPLLATPPTSKLLQHVGDLMFRLLIPEQMQSYLLDSAASKLGSLTITTNDHELPWELMYANGQFLCLE